MRYVVALFSVFCSAVFGGLIPDLALDGPDVRNIVFSVVGAAQAAFLLWFFALTEK